MAEAKAASEWAHTSALLALLANVHRDPKKTKAFTPNDFNPLASRQRPGVPEKEVGLKILKTVFVDGKDS